MAVGTEFQITPISEFWKIAKEKETFFWHFALEDSSGPVTLKSLSEKNLKRTNPLKVIVETFGVDVYESYTKDSIEFLLEIGAHTNHILNPNSRTFNPIFVGFQKGKKIAATNIDGICYCVDGVVEIIALTDPNKFGESLLGIEKEDLE
jgi:hypothetical protein